MGSENGDPEPCKTKVNRKKCGQEWVDKYQDLWLKMSQYECCYSPDTPSPEDLDLGGADKKASGDEGAAAAADEDLDAFLDEL